MTERLTFDPVRPLLSVVVDTEEEFDWRAPFSRSSVATRSIPAQATAHEIYDRLGVVPTYVIDYPVATDPAAIAFFDLLRRAGKAEIGAHLHPWVCPPHEEEVGTRNSYQCNLPPELERAKIETLTKAIGSAFDARPTIFKAGRHGLGANTIEVLADLGYKVDCSVVPHVSFASDGGPDFYGRPDQPYWLDKARRLLEIPVTSGYSGLAAALAPRVAPLFDHPAAHRLRLPGLLARSGMIERSRLSPEGIGADEQCRLLKHQVDSGRKFFTLVYHSPSLAPGNTPYVRTEAERVAFLKRIEEVLVYFRDVLGGEFTTLNRVHQRAAAALAGPDTLSAAA